ncbi:MAG TPA: helix-turn-helix transcriptional regulator [Chloroflexia bacterium]|nr:helix-turn-helix transcriptional regulator [Chloroflexia bacterium]
MRPSKVEKRDLAALEYIRKAAGISVAELAAIANISEPAWYAIERGKETTLNKVYLAISMLGYRIDDVLKMHKKSLPVLLQGVEPFIRLPHTIVQADIVEKVRELNNLQLLEEEHYWAGGFRDRCEILVATSRKIAEKELLTPAYLKQHRAEYVIPGPAEQVRILEMEAGSTREGLKLGAAYTALCKELGLSTSRLSEMTGLSRPFFIDLQNDLAEPMLGSLDIASRAVGLTVDELIYTAHPEEGQHKWIFFVPQNSYCNRQMVELVTSEETLQYFAARTTPVEERARMMLAYKAWLRAEAEASISSQAEQRVIMPAAFRLLGWRTA